jgi:hypothetical protein
MAVIEYNDLTKGQKVYYTYTTMDAVYGPFTVVSKYRNYQGENVFLRGKGGDVRSVLLADDEDFGAPLFYDKPPGA